MKDVLTFLINHIYFDKQYNDFIIFFSMSRKSKKTECPICLQKIKYKVITECNHTFCDSCLIKHLIIQQNCPLCRSICDNQYITEQINPKRQGILTKKYILPITVNHIEPVQYNSYSRFLNPNIMISNIFILETLCIIALLFFIVTQVKMMIAL
jgi:hypothetical protein